MSDTNVHDESRADTPPPAELLWWTYCVVRAPDAATAAHAREGIEPGTSVETVSYGDLAALISWVPRAEYGDDRLREHLEDLDWLALRARRHEDVLEAVLGQATVVPLRLCTLFRARDGVRRLLLEHRRPLVEGLARVDGCVEWGVKVFSDPDASAGQAEPERQPSERPGAAYLLRRQKERALAEKASEARARCAQLVHGRVGAMSRAATTNPPQHPEAHGRELKMLLNGAYLIERDRVAELKAAVDDLHEEWSSRGFAIELTGPWPPYNFVAGAAGLMS